tara:strand:+ start:207 stop:734 length:528 start_codon:yes stop_codon:yes gene_type:complete
MRLLKDAIEDFDTEVLLEQEGSTTGAVGGFTGRAGQDIDDLYAGPFHPKFNNLKKSLQQQIEDTLAKRLYTDDFTPLSEEDYVDLEWDYHYDEVISTDKSNFINRSMTNMKYVDTKIKYDKNEDLIDKSNFINSSEKNWKNIEIDLKYDKNESIYNKDNYINDSKTNWKIIQRRK